LGLVLRVVDADQVAGAHRVQAGPVVEFVLHLIQAMTGS
jgi:hypothetical protein